MVSKLSARTVVKSKSPTKFGVLSLHLNFTALLAELVCISNTCNSDDREVFKNVCSWHAMCEEWLFEFYIISCRKCSHHVPMCVYRAGMKQLEKHEFATGVPCLQMFETLVAGFIEHGEYKQQYYYVVKKGPRNTIGQSA